MQEKGSSRDEILFIFFLNKPANIEVKRFFFY